MEEGDTEGLCLLRSFSLLTFFFIDGGRRLEGAAWVLDEELVGSFKISDRESQEFAEDIVWFWRGRDCCCLVPEDSVGGRGNRNCSGSSSSGGTILPTISVVASAADFQMVAAPEVNIDQVFVH